MVTAAATLDRRPGLDPRLALLLPPIAVGALVVANAWAGVMPGVGFCRVTKTPIAAFSRSITPRRERTWSGLVFPPLTETTMSFGSLSVWSM